jgi:hypothetical protein
MTLRFVRFAALAGTIAAALALAILRLYVEPIFGSSDEDDHFDYAISIARAGHLLSAKNALGSPTADLESAFLQTYSDRPRIYLNTAERVPPGYGTHQYFRRIDVRSRAELPDPHARMNAPDHPNPVLVSMYPFGYYALAASAIGAASALRPSLSDAFFGARYVSVGLLAIVLVACYGIARELGLRRPAALAFTGIVGCFALTTFVASYVQPDNLACAAVCVACHACLRARRARSLGAPTAVAAVAFGALAVTKYQTALCVGVAVFPMLALEAYARTRSWRAVGRTLVLGIAPAAAALAVQALAVGRNDAFAASVDTHFHAFTSLQNFPAEFARFCAGCAEAAWYFFIGNVAPPMTHDYRMAAAISYWNYFGNLDTPVTLVSPGVDRAARTLIAVLTGSVFLLALAGSARVAVRLARVARGGRRLRALRVAAGNVPLNAYYVFCAFMIVFYALTDNNWRTSGRNFYPFVVPALLLAVRYAPRALPDARLRRAFAAVTFGGLALYATFGSYDAALAVERRYYGPPALGPLASFARGSGGALVIDRVGTGPIASAQFVMNGAPLVRPVAHGQTLEIEGLAVDLARGDAAGGVFAVLDGRKPYAASYGYAHQDLAERFDDDRFFWAGFQAAIPTDNVGFGPHRITFEVVSHDGRRVTPVRVAVNANVAPPAPARPLVIGDNATLTGSLDQVTSLENAAAFGAEPQAVSLERTQTLFVRGWLVDLAHRAPLRAMDAVVDGRARFPVHLGDVRPELRATFPQLPPLVAAYAGFAGVVPLRSLPAGPHRFDLVAVDAGGHRVTLVRDFPFESVEPGRRRPTVEPPEGPLPRAFGAPGDYAGSVDQVSPLRNATYWTQGPAWLDQSEMLFVKGWGLDLLHRRNLAPIVAIVDGRTHYAARLGDVRPDVMLGYADLPASATDGAGWSVAIPVRGFARGAHEVSVTSVDPRTGRPLVLASRLPFTIR